MAKTTKNNSNNKSAKRQIALIVLLLMGITIGAGIITAYFSDIFVTDGNIKSSTLDIEVTHEVSLNGATTTLASIQALNPGDVIVIKGTVTNIGNQSAWVREQLGITATDTALLSFFEVYNIELTQADFATAYDFGTNLYRQVDDTTFASGERVINGVGTDATTESGGDYNYVRDTEYDFAMTIYFSAAATNVAQNQTFGLTFATKALQFANNNASVPTDVAWATIS